MLPRGGGLLPGRLCAGVENIRGKNGRDLRAILAFDEVSIKRKSPLAAHPHVTVHHGVFFSPTVAGAGRGG